jgi:D-3-phosphoglycerate dehydrogenase
MKALITAPFDQEGLKKLRKYMDIAYESWKETGKIFMDPVAFINRIKEVNADVLIVEADTVDEEVVDAIKPKIVGCCRGNPINVDIEALRKRNIPFFHTPARNAEAVAELTIAMMLSVSRHLVAIDRTLSSGNFFVDDEKGLVGLYNRFVGVELSGKKVGIIGLGNVGYEVAKKLQGFNPEILVYDPYAKDSRIEEVGGKRVKLETLMRESDYITIHTPVTPETEMLVGEKEFSLMKPSSFFFNLARAYCIDEDALYRAIEEKKISGAGLDVHSTEPVDSSNRFLKFNNVVVTPHIGGQTEESIKRQSIAMAEQIEQYLQSTKRKIK